MTYQHAQNITLCVLTIINFIINTSVLVLLVYLSLQSGRNKENGQEGNDEDKQLEPTKPGQEAETLLVGESNM